MILDLATGVIGLGILLTAWIAFQAWYRRQHPVLPEDHDVLQGRFGCFGCSAIGCADEEPNRSTREEVGQERAPLLRASTTYPDSSSRRDYAIH